MIQEWEGQRGQYAGRDLDLTAEERGGQVNTLHGDEDEEVSRQYI